VPRPRTALETATAALAWRDRSTADLTAYLERRGATADDAARAVERLAEAGYVDDGRYAQRRAEVLAGRGQGDAAIRFVLEHDGVDGDAIDAAIDALVPERERAAALLRAAPTAVAGARRLAAKGFSADAVESALAALPEAEAPG
jgi:regulatory protein